MKQIEKKLKESIVDRKSVFLFTGSKESTLLINILNNMDVKIVFIDTGCHFSEIINYAKSYEDRIEIIQNHDTSSNPAIDWVACCTQKKYATLQEYLKNFNAECLIVPFRDEEKDNGIEESYLKGLDNIEIIRPLDCFSEEDVWIKIKEFGLPYSTIYNKGYKTVDCSCCTTRLGRKKRDKAAELGGIDRETEEKLKALGYM